MTGRVADLLQIVVLPTRADALLAGDRARIVTTFQTLEHALELHHAGVREQQGGVVRRNQRRAWHLLVPLALEVVDELAADVGGLHGGKI